MTFDEALPVLVVLVPALIGLGGYWWQEKVKRDSAEAERRQNLYETLIGALIGLLGASSGAKRSQLMTEIEKAWLFASTEVLNKCYDYLTEYDKVCSECMSADGGLEPRAVVAKLRGSPETRQELGAKLMDVFLAMREDLGGDVELDEIKEAANFQIYSWGVLSDEPAEPPATAP